MPEDYELDTLGNGLTIAHKYVAGVPDIALAAFFTVGAASIPPGKDEAPHFIEHMFFKPTSKYPVNIPGLIHELTGREIGSSTAQTTLDHIVLRHRIPRQNQQPFFEFLFDSVDNLDFDATEVEKERQVIIGELRRERTGINALFGRIGPALLPGYFRNSTPEEAEQLSYGDIVDFKRLAVTGPNTYLLLVGSVDDDTLAIVTSYFQNLRSGCKISQAIPPRELEPTFLSADFEGTDSLTYHTHWQVPPVSNAEYPLIHFLFEYLASGISSRVGRELRETLPAAHGVSMLCETLVAAGHASITVSDFPTHLYDKVIGVIEREINRVQAGHFDENHLARLRTSHKLTFFERSREVMESRLDTMVDQVILARPYSDEEVYDLIAGVNSTDLTRVAQKYLTTNTVDVLTAPKGQLPEGIEHMSFDSIAV